MPLTGPVPRLAESLAAGGAPSLAELLAVRPDVLWAPPPRDLGELAERLDDPRSVALALQQGALPCLQAAEALQALGGRAARSQLLALLGVEEDPAQVEPALAWLTERAVVRTGADGVLEASPALQACFPDPLRLGPPLAALLETQTSEALKGVLRVLGRPVPGRKAEALAEVTALLSDPEQVRDVVATAPPGVAEELARLGLGRDPDLLLASGRFDPAAYRREQEALRWATARGLVFSPTWGYGHEMPAEVARVLRGPGYRAPFTPGAPAVPTQPVAPEAVDRESAAASSTFSGQATAVLDALARTGVPALRSGGVGARELTRLARATGADEVVVRLVLELAGEAGLLEADGQRVVADEGLSAWRDGEPAQRYVDLVAAWWRYGGTPTQTREDGKALPALQRAPTCEGCTGARHGLLAALAAVEPGAATTAAGVGRAAAWARPLVHAEVEGDDVPFAAPWREAELLGLVARGALAPLGRHLLAGDVAALAALAGELLPGTVDRAVFGPDLTAVVTGTPSARVTTLLDSCADRESRGGAVVWRLTPGSVRRALDEGTSGEELERRLAEVAQGDLPQPLRYLVGDVARRHGSLRVRPVASVVRSDDVALLAQVAADRSLERLRLSLLAPTVLASGQPAEETVAALRGAGYLPVPEEVTSPGVVHVQRRASAGAGSRGRAAVWEEAAAPVDVAALAERLVAAGTGSGRRASTGTEQAIAAVAPRLPAQQVRLLAHAVDAGDDVVVEYLSQSGGLTQRQIGDLRLSGGALHAWCRLREDDRSFTVSRIQSVRPAR